MPLNRTLKKDRDSKLYMLFYHNVNKWGGEGQAKNILRTEVLLFSSQIPVGGSGVGAESGQELVNCTQGRGETRERIYGKACNSERIIFLILKERRPRSIAFP